MKLSFTKMGLAAVVAGGLMSTAVSAGEQWWPADVNAYSPSCTGGSAECWAEEANNPAALPVTQYVPLMPDEVDSKHHICVSFPHLKDSYWVGVGYGIISEVKRLGQKVTLVEAGGYTNLERQLSQIEDCVANGADALIISAISGDGNTKQVDEIRAKGIPVVDLVNGINTQIDAKSLESWYLLGYMACG
jgi:periplasmic protein TorT